MTTLSYRDNPILNWVLWALVVVVGTVWLGIVALNRGESVNAAWLIVAAVCTYLLAYRFYGLFIADKLLRIDPARPTPAHRRNDGLDYVPINRYVLFGHHFAAIAGAGPLVGPVLAAQMGYLPANSVDPHRRGVCRRSAGSDRHVSVWCGGTVARLAT